MKDVEQIDLFSLEFTDRDKEKKEFIEKSIKFNKVEIKRIYHSLRLYKDMLKNSNQELSAYGEKKKQYEIKKAEETLKKMKNEIKDIDHHSTSIKRGKLYESIGSGWENFFIEEDDGKGGNK